MISCRYCRYARGGDTWWVVWIYRVVFPFFIFPWFASPWEHARCHHPSVVKAESRAHMGLPPKITGGGYCYIERQPWGKCQEEANLFEPRHYYRPAPTAPRSNPKENQ